MEWLAANWFFLAVLAVCCGMHLFGHGGHGDHGHQNRGDSSSGNEAGSQADPKEKSTSD